MAAGVDATHDPARRSWVQSANGHAEFPIQNLPLGMFSPQGGTKRPGIAIGDSILDLEAAGLLPAGRFADGLNAFLEQGAEARGGLRRAAAALLDAGSEPRPEFLHEAAACAMQLPVRIGDYTDFYAGIHHATNIGRLFRPDAPLLTNYKHIPIAYHGRASSVRVSGDAVRRPSGQTKPPGAEAPAFGPTKRLDYELELGIWMGPGNALGAPVPVAFAADHIAGFCLLNDWSARDIQAWEYQPLGPFLAKNFHTTISPWIVTPEALAPFRVAQAARPDGDPRPLPYLWDEADQAEGALDLRLEVYLMTPGLRAGGHGAHRLSAGNARDLYWTVAQMVAHHTSGGCSLRAGDLFGSGTISGAADTARGSLMEIAANGAQPVRLASGEERSFLRDGDEVIFSARAEREGFVPIGFGECRGIVEAGRG
jgi:fumarylacetoacetase